MGQPLLVIQQIVRVPRIENRQGRAVFGNLIQPVENMPIAFMLPHNCQSILQGVDYSFRLALAGQGGEIGGELLSVTIADIERHISIRNEKLLYSYILAGESIPPEIKSRPHLHTDSLAFNATN